MATKKKTAEIVEESIVQTEPTETSAPAEKEDTPKKSTKKTTTTKKTATKKPAAKKTTAKKTATTKSGLVTDEERDTLKNVVEANEQAIKENEVPAEFAVTDSVPQTPKQPAKKTSDKVDSKKDGLGVAERRYNTEQIITIGETLSVKTEAAIYNEAAIDIRDSMQNRKILTDTIDGMETIDGHTVAVLYHGDIKVMIPLEDVVNPPTHIRSDVKRRDAHEYMLTKRLGAEIDYVIVDLDNKNTVAVGNRHIAMEIKKNTYYFRKDRDDDYILYNDRLCEARVVATIKDGIFVELFGIETYIPIEELSWQRMVDATEHFVVGNIILVRIQKLERNLDDMSVNVKVSVKRTTENPALKAIKTLSLKQKYVGTITQVDVEAVYVRLNCGVDCRCDFPKRGSAVRGSKATVAISWIDEKKCRVWGKILSMSAVI